MERVLDVRGLQCPIPLLRARALLPELGPGDALVVVATDAEAPVDLGALAADEGLTFAVTDAGGVWRIALRRPR
jgi:tRNA 2-thiouridine synthesizing protein A